jgi:hypothetical protein
MMRRGIETDSPDPDYPWKEGFVYIHRTSSTGQFSAADQPKRIAAETATAAPEDRRRAMQISCDRSDCALTTD